MNPLPVRLLKSLWSARRDIAGAAIYWSGIAAVFEMTVKPAGAIILMYHSIAPTNCEKYIDPPNRMSPGMFDRQMAFLAKYRRVVSLSQIVRDVASGDSPAAGTVCITFDDGYLDNLTTAAPILEKYKLPATLFLATGYVERSEAQWADVMFWIIGHRTSDHLSVPDIGLDMANLASSADMLHSRTLLHKHLLESTHGERRQVLHTLQRQLKPAGTPPRLTLNWNEVRNLIRQFPRFEIGGHTRDHIDLRTHYDETARSQIIGCADDLRRELDLKQTHFSFPYARWCPQTRNMVRALDWQSAVGMGKSIRIGAGSDLFSMPRVEAPKTMTELRFKTSGAYPGALPQLRKK